MSIPFIPGVPRFNFGSFTAAAGTVINGLVPPYFGPRTAPVIFGPLPAITPGNPPKAPAPNWYTKGYITHVTLFNYTTGTTAHAITVMRPLNFTSFKVAVPANTTAVTLSTDPGLYSTSFNYQLPGPATAPALVADHALAAGDTVAYQLADGTWQADLIASGTFAGNNIVLAKGTPNRPAATIAAGSPLFYFGISTLADPATGLAPGTFPTTASTTANIFTPGANGEGFPALRPGDPMLVQSNNITAAGTLNFIAGDYGEY